MLEQRVDAHVMWVRLPSFGFFVRACERVRARVSGCARERTRMRRGGAGGRNTEGLPKEALV